MAGFPSAERLICRASELGCHLRVRTADGAASRRAPQADATLAIVRASGMSTVDVFRLGAERTRNAAYAWERVGWYRVFFADHEGVALEHSRSPAALRLLREAPAERPSFAAGLRDALASVA